MDIHGLNYEPASSSADSPSVPPTTPSLLSPRLLPPAIQLQCSTHSAASDVIKREDSPILHLAYPSTSSDTSSDTQMSNCGSMAVIEAYPRANIFHVRLHYRNPFVDEKVNPRLRIYMDNVPLKTVIIHAPGDTVELRGTMPPNFGLADPIKVSIQATLENENEIFDYVYLGMYNASSLMAGG